jgi:hypothetical protein
LCSFPLQSSSIGALSARYLTEKWQMGGGDGSLSPNVRISVSYLPLNGEIKNLPSEAAEICQLSERNR